MAKNRVVLDSSDDDENTATEDIVVMNAPPSENTRRVIYDMNTDISKLETPRITTFDREPSQLLQSLDWSHEPNLIAKKVENLTLHFCEKCTLPIIKYGRMVPCKHVLCLDCAKSRMSKLSSFESGAQNSSNVPAPFKLKCSHCDECVSHIETVSLGSIHMCTHQNQQQQSPSGSTPPPPSSCARTYLSDRDLQAHVRFRHPTTTTHQRAQ